MEYSVIGEYRMEEKEMRSALCETMMNMAAADPRIVMMDADLMGAMGMRPFAAAYPERMVDCGIQEANMIGVAAGLSATGKIPFVHSFGPFVTRRVCDQVFMSGAYAKSNIKIIGSDPGITAQINGGTHMPFEDMGIMRGIPELTVLEPTDITMLKWMLPVLKDTYGVQYLRLVRKQCPKVYADGSTFDMKHAPVLREGKDVTIIASGFCTAQALLAAAALQETGISARVVNTFCWKPIDAETIEKAARETGAIVTAENHNVINGLGSAVAEVLVRTFPVPQEMVGSQDRFGQVGKLDFLSEEYGMTAPYIAEACKKVIARKKA